MPSCPGWNVGQLVRHLGGGQRWAAEVVRTRAASPPSDTHFRDLSAFTHEDPAVVGPWTADVDVLGDDQLLDFWLQRVAFG